MHFCIAKRRTMNGSNTFDIIIVGAGISGLASARYVLSKEASLKVLVIEATDRVGGRTLTGELKTENGTDKWDLGAHWVGRCQTHIMALIKELGLETHQQYLSGRKFLQVGKDNVVKSYLSDIPTLSLLALLDLDRFMKKVDSLAQEVDTDNPYSCRRAKEFDGTTVETFINQNMWMSESKETFIVAIRGVLGIELSQISMLYFLAYISAAGGLRNLVEGTPYRGQEYNVVGGTHQISEQIAEQLGKSRVLLGEPVKSITQTQNGVEIETEKGNIFKCQKMILAIPPNQIGKIRFDPILPTEKRELIKRMHMGNYIKILITYKEAFWRAAGHSGEVVSNGGFSTDLQCSTGPICLVFDDTGPNGHPALVVFNGGYQAVEWRNASADSKKSAILKSLAEFFGQKVHDYIDYIEKDWDLEPYVEGAPVCVAGPGAMRYYKDGLRKPFQNIHFAGTETATIWTGYMSGAVQAGHRAAIEVLMNIRPQVASVKDLEENNIPFKGPPC